MRRMTFFICSLTMILILMSFGTETPNTVPNHLKANDDSEVLFPRQIIGYSKWTIVPPFLGKSYVGFKEALAFKESQGDYFTTSSLGYLGKYQFGTGTLELLGVYNVGHFLNDPLLQERTFHTNISRNKWILRKDIRRFSGTYINGVEITESGILAAAHLAGAGNVKKYLRSYGSFEVSDGFGTSITDYIGRFSGYDVSAVPPLRNPRVPRMK